jgi:hypothetical protein
LRGVLLGITCAAYHPVWENDFVDFDDEPFVTQNPRVCAGLTESGARWAVFNDESPYRMPLTWLSLQIDVELSLLCTRGESRLRPEIFHAHNLFWHAVNVLLVFGLCLRLPGGTPARGFPVAALFAVHPMHVESVAWAVERKDVLMCAFGLLCVRAYLRYGETRGWAAYLGVIVALSLSLAAKPMLLTLPFVLLLFDYWPLCRTSFSPDPPPAPGRSPARVSVGHLLIEKVPLFVIVLLVAVETARTRPGVSLSAITLADRLMNALAGYAWYVSTTFYPMPLAAVYPHPHADWSVRQSLTGAVILASVTALALWHAKRRPWLIVGWLWFVGTLFPLMGLAQGGPQAWADRFSYWPHIGLFIALVWCYADCATHLRIPVFASVLLWAAVLIGLAALTSVQVTYWRNSVLLWEHAAAVTERNAYAHERLSLAYRREGRIVEAEYHLSEAHRILRARRSLRK